MIDIRQEFLHKQAPDFALTDQNGIVQQLNIYRGKWIVLYFYPKDDTPGCTTEACSFRDHSDELTQKNITVFGVSADSVRTHKKFAQKYHLTYPLLADTEKKVISLYDAWGKKKKLNQEYEGILRKTYLINPQGIIKKIYKNVQPENHSQEILKDIQTL